MARPTKKMKSNTYYHGTATEKAGQGILKHGITPPDLTDRKGKLKPIDGRVYLTHKLEYALVYLLQGNVLGSSYVMPSWDKEPYGYLFVIDGKSLVDIQPDEDNVGELIWDTLDHNKGGWRDTPFNWLMKLAKEKLTNYQYSKVKEGEYADWAVAGKKLIPLMTDMQKLQIIESGAHISHTGKIIPSQSWKFEKINAKNLLSDGSNFFELAERIK